MWGKCSLGRNDMVDPKVLTMAVSLKEGLRGLPSMATMVVNGLSFGARVPGFET